MRVGCKKGYALIIAIIFVITLMTASVGLYFSSELLTKEIKFEEEKYIKGYYAAIAGLRYAEKVFLDNPTSIVFTGSSYTILGDEFGGNFFTDIGVPKADLIITITDDAGTFVASATYSY